MTDATILSLGLAMGQPEKMGNEVAVAPSVDFSPAVVVGRARLVQADCLEWLSAQPASSFHAVVTDPPYGLVEYTPKEQEKLRKGRGGVWRLPPSFDGCKRSPLPRFTTLTALDLARMERFFRGWASERNLSTTLRHFTNQVSEPSFPWPSAPSPGSAPSTSLTGSARLIQTSALSSAARGGPATKRSGRAA